MSKLVDNVTAAKLIKMLVQPIEKTPAFKLGLVDASGNKLREPETAEENNSYNWLTRLVFNMKKIIEKTKQPYLKSMMHAAYLIKEMSDGYDVLSDEEMLSEIESAFLVMESTSVEIDPILEEVVTSAALNLASHKEKPLGKILKRKPPVGETIK